MKKEDLQALLNRAAAAMETPDDLTAEEHQHIREDLLFAAEELETDDKRTDLQKAVDKLIGSNSILSDNTRISALEGIGEALVSLRQEKDCLERRLERAALLGKEVSTQVEALRWSLHEVVETSPRRENSRHHSLSGDELKKRMLDYYRSEAGIQHALEGLVQIANILGWQAIVFRQDGLYFFDGERSAKNTRVLSHEFYQEFYQEFYEEKSKTFGPIFHVTKDGHITSGNPV